MPILPNTAPEMMPALPAETGSTPSVFTAAWEASKRIPGALSGGAIVGATTGLIMAGAAYLLGDISFVHELIVKAGSTWALAGDFAVTHAIGHACYDGIVQSKARYDEVMHKTGTLAEREAQAETAMAHAVEQGLETPVMAVEREVGMLADRKPTSRAVQEIIARGAQTQNTASWQARMAAQDAQRSRGSSDIPL